MTHMAMRSSDALMSERDWQRVVTDYADLTGWDWFFNADSRRTQPGFPDLTLIRPPQLLFVELKRVGGRPTAKQLEVIDKLRACGQFAAVYWPQDWPLIKSLLDFRPLPAGRVPTTEEQK